MDLSADGFKPSAFVHVGVAAAGAADGMRKGNIRLHEGFQRSDGLQTPKSCRSAAVLESKLA